MAELFSAYYAGEVRDSTDFTYSSYVDGTTQGGSYDVSYTVSGGTVTSATINGQLASYDSTTVV